MRHHFGNFRSLIKERRRRRKIGRHMSSILVNKKKHPKNARFQYIQLDFSLLLKRFPIKRINDEIGNFRKLKVRSKL